MNFRSVVESRHQAYSRTADEWNFFLASYRGGAEYVRQGNLFSHRLEHKGPEANDFAERRRRSYYLNYCRPIVDLYTSYLFKEQPHISPDEPFAHLFTDADGKGVGLVEFMKRTATLSSIFGHVWVGTDRPKDGGRAYLTMFYPQNFLNWETDGHDRLEWCLVREPWGRCEVVKEADRIGIIDGKSWVYRLWTTDEWFVLDSKGRLIEQGEHGYGCVPFVCVKHRDVEGELLGESLIADIAYVNREIYNLSSLLQEILARQTFSQLVAQGSSEEYGDIARLGTSSIFLYPEGKNAPQFISPDTSQAQILIDAIDRAISEIYRLANLRRGSVTGETEQSGISKAFDFLDTYQVLADKAQQTEDGFRRVLELYSLVDTGEVREVKVRLTRSFGVERTGELIDETKKLFELGIPDAFRRELLKQLAHTKLAGAPRSARDGIMREIEGMRFDEIAQPASQPTGGGREA